MMRAVDEFETTLRSELGEIEQAGLLRQLRRIEALSGSQLSYNGQWLTHFASNDYLGFASHQALIDAASSVAHDFGAGSGASRLVCGSLAIHHRLEESLAAWKGTEAALAFSSGYAAASGTIPALLGKDDVVVVDRLVHACCIDAARLSGATLRVFRHNDLNDLERILIWANQLRSSGDRRAKILIVTESVFSMDGDRAPLKEIVELKDHHGAWLMLDEAHATGLYGAKHCGLAEETGVADRIEISMGTLSKALGSSGGFIAGRRVLIDLLINSARSFIFSTAPTPSAAASAAAAIQLLLTPKGDEAVRNLWDNIQKLGQCLSVAAGTAIQPQSAIVPWIIGDESTAMAAAAGLLEEGIFIPAIRYPTVARGKARLRFSITARHKNIDFQKLESALRSAPVRGSAPHA